MHNKPKYHRPLQGPKGQERILGWEVYSKRAWWITISFGSFEIQFNKWPLIEEEDDDDE